MIRRGAFDFSYTVCSEGLSLFFKYIAARLPSSINISDGEIDFFKAVTRVIAANAKSIIFVRKIQDFLRRGLPDKINTFYSFSAHLLNAFL